MMFRTCRQF